MRCSLPFIATICLSAGLAVGAGGGGSEALADQELSNIFRDTEEVHVINVDVVVTDAEGRPVTGLTAEDFRLFEDGRPVEISNFYPVDEGRPVPLPAEATGGLGGRDVGGRREGTPAAPAEPAPPPELHLVVYIDNVHLSPIHRNRVLTRLDELLSRSWRPGMSVMLVSNERALEIRQPFTDRREDVLAALDGLKSTGSRGSRLDQDREALLAAMGQVSVDIGSGLFDTKAGLSGGARSVGPGTEGEEEGPQQQGPGVVSQSDLTAKVAAEAYALVPQLLAYAQARNDEVAASLDVLERLVDLLSGLPGRKAVLHVSDGLSANPAEAIFEAFDRLFEVLPRSPNLVGLSKEAVRFDLLADFRDLAAAANAGRVSLYTLDASPPEAVSRAGAENANEIRNLGFSSTEERNAQESLVLLAEETGGRSSLSNVTLDSTVTGLFADFGSYYSLGYAAEREPGRERHIEVRLADRRRGVTVRYRRTMRDREPQELMAERTLAALVLGTAENPLQVKLEALDPQPAEDGNFLVPVRVRIPLAKLVLIPGAREHEARVSMYVAAVDDRGRASEVIRQVCPIRIPNAELLVALGGHAECGVRLLVRPGEQRVAVSVRDEMSARDSTVQLDLEVPEAPAVGRGPDGESEPDEVGSRGGDSRSAEAPRASR